MTHQNLRIGKCWKLFWATFYYSLLDLIDSVAVPDREYLLFASIVCAGFFNFWKVINISCFWQLNVSDDDDEADSLIKEAEGSEEEVENEDDDLLPF